MLYSCISGKGVDADGRRCGNWKDLDPRIDAAGTLVWKEDRSQFKRGPHRATCRPNSSFSQECTYVWNTCLRKKYTEGGCGHASPGRGAGAKSTTVSHRYSRVCASRPPSVVVPSAAKTKSDHKDQILVPHVHLTCARTPAFEKNVPHSGPRSRRKVKHRRVSGPVAP